MVAMLPLMATNYEQLADGVYQVGTTLYIGSSVTSLGDLQVNPSEIYCYATIPPACSSNTFTGYDATLHVPAAGMVSYFTTLYWYNFNNILSDAIEPLSVILNTTDTELEIGQQLSLSATIAPGNATPKFVYWSSTDASIATVSEGTVTAVAVGECDILATCVDKVAICHVTIVPPRVTITLDKHEALLLPNHTMTLTLTCSPIDVDLAVKSSNPGVVIPRLVNGIIMVVGVSEGTATITVNAADGWGNPDMCEVTVYTEHGDVNCDGYVDIDDVTRLIDYLLTGNSVGLSLDNANVDNKGGIDIDDVTTLIDYLLNGIWSWQQDQTFTVNGVSFKMVYVEGGTFTMGATAELEDDAEEYEKPIHEVFLSDYRIGETEVTQALWLAVMGNNPSRYTGDLSRPVEQVSWNDCQTFISKLNEMTGKHFRLLTEAEWEYAARGGKKSHGFKYSGSNIVGDVAWYNGNSNNTTHPVATKNPNELGIYDMSGNVYEWCLDWFDFYSQDKQINPIGPTSGILRVNRGGCFGSIVWGGRVTSRYNNNPDERMLWLGLRLAIDPEDSPKFRLSETVVTLLVGENKSVDILYGNGIYSLEGGSDNVTSTINDNCLTVTGTNKGITTVYVTNITTGTTAVLTVIVVNPNVVDGHEYVDLGLPSGTLWATCNVGADKPEEYGYYFAWGETQPKDCYNWSTYMLCNGSYNTLTKYCYACSNSYGIVDNKKELECWDDAAYVNLGDNWRIPTYDQFNELKTNCTWTWTIQNGETGYLVTGSNGESLFFPAAGDRWSGSLSNVGTKGFYWCRTLSSYCPSDAYDLGFNSQEVFLSTYGRHNGISVRPVLEPQN